MWFEPEKEGGVRKLKTERFLTDCPTDGKNYTICRKIFQNGKNLRIIITNYFNSTERFTDLGKLNLHKVV
jgi:hypothetical protein